MAAVTLGEPTERGQSHRKLPPQSMLIGYILAAAGRAMTVRDVAAELTEIVGDEVPCQSVRDRLGRLVAAGHAACTRGIGADRSGIAYVWRADWVPSPPAAPGCEREYGDLCDAAALLAAGHSRSDVASWTYLTDDELRMAEAIGGPFAAVVTPNEIRERAAQVRASWAPEVHAARCGGYRRRDRGPMAHG